MPTAIKHDFTFFAKLLLGIGIFIFAAYCWNYWYHSYLSSNDYRGDIFRTGLKDTLQPFYLLPETNAGRSWTVYVAGAFALLLACIAIIWEGKNRLNYLLLSAIYLMLVIAFAFSESDARLFGLSSHYQTFANDLHLFSGLRDLMANYTSRQHLMDVHGQHYPPGNLALLMLCQKLGWLPLAKVVSILCGLACVILSIKSNPKNILPLLLALSPGMLIFPSLDFVPIPALLGLCSFIAFKKSLELGKNTWWLCLGILLAVFSLFSYSVSVLLLFFAIWFWVNKISIITHFKGIIWAGVSSLVCLGLVWLFSGFNQYACFVQSVSNNSELLQSNGFDSVARYLFRSTGNLLGMFYSGGLLVFLVLISKRNPTIKTWLMTVLIASFSGLFFGETERIWLFMLPLCAFAETIVPSTKIGKALLVTLALSIAVWQEVAYRHFL